ncbi:uncharacterized protein LOC131623775 isoform X1 [Vicia villosa]|uniref:uncharacterized protein LOC131623775 isoform X1 n=1 Tax=Vicia villosa TaxID=3911 RepID=UPI00273C2375|nr:uncharacterized protein LOC131623775 isoform X1 [Vicia villosa]
MASIFNILFLTLFLALAFQVDIVAYGQPCALSAIEVKQTKTSRSAWNVTVTNNCICTQSQVKFNVNGFKSSTPVDPAIFSQDGLLIQGAPLYGFKSVSFTYSSDSQFAFTPISSQVACS